jgi:uncharacterized protein (DUF2236 family)
MAPEFVYPEPDRTSSDPGLFGPNSITWQMHADPACGIGGVRALLLQALHPRAMAGLAANSDYEAQAWGRLFRTAQYIAVITYGTTDEAERAAARVRGIHRKLKIDEPDLLMWVHYGFVDSMLTTYQRTVGLSPELSDQYVAEQREAARLIGLDPAAAPSTVAELTDYLDSVKPELRATAEAREGARFILLPPMRSDIKYLTPAVPAWAGLAATAFALQPRWARAMYGGPVVGVALAGVPRIADLQATIAAKAWRQSLLALPDSIRRGPVLAAAEERLGLLNR